jgi:hypothetical protein
LRRYTKAITFSSMTTPNIFQFTVEASVEKRQGRTFGRAWQILLATSTNT